MSKKYRIGILAVQGAFAEHAQMLEQLGAETFLIRQRADLDLSMDGIVLPGGESTVQGKLLRELNMFSVLKDKLEAGLPVFGTCAGMILLAKKLENDERVHLGLMDITVRRNAYGRQLGSFMTRAQFGSIGEVSMPFIRAPYIVKWGENTVPLAQVDGKTVAAREKNMLAISFHPEVSGETEVHRYFLSMVKQYQK